MMRRKWHGILWLWLALLAGAWLLAGCSQLCTKRLYLYRDAEAKGRPTSGQALLITDPQLAQALAPAAVNLQGGLPWAPEQPFYESDYYQLSMEAVDDQPVYQGLCLDTTPTYSLEVRPGARRLRLSLNLFGPWGREKVQEVAAVNLVPGGVYFLSPEMDAAKSRHLVLKVQRLPQEYDAQLRTRVMDWNRQHLTGRTIAD
jgi:hypothetical protein